MAHCEKSITEEVSRIQCAAWDMYNAAYGVPDGTPYRDAGRALYKEDMHLKIERLFSRSDAQDLLLDDINRFRIKAVEHPIFQSTT